MTSHLSRSNVNVHPALHNGLIPIRDATVRWVTMCPGNTYGNPWMVMSHICIDFIFLPSGMIMLKGLLAQLLLTTLVPSIMNMDVAPVSAMAWVDVIVIAFKYSCKGWPKRECAAPAHESCMHVRCGRVWFGAQETHVAAAKAGLLGTSLQPYAAKLPVDLLQATALPTWAGLSFLKGGQVWHMYSPTCCPLWHRGHLHHRGVIVCI